MLRYIQTYYMRRDHRVGRPCGNDQDLYPGSLLLNKKLQLIRKYYKIHPIFKWALGTW